MSIIRPQRIVILVAGRRYSGKDTAADMIASIMGAQRGAFADELKREYAIRSGADVSRLRSDAAYKEQHRQALIDMATAARSVEPTIWARLCAEHHPVHLLVVSDYRFANEREYFKSEGYRVITIRIDATDETRRSRGWVPSSIDADPSETGEGLEPWTAAIRNNGTRLELAAAILATLQELYIR